MIYVCIMITLSLVFLGKLKLQVTQKCWGCYWGSMESKLLYSASANTQRSCAAPR